MHSPAKCTRPEASRAPSWTPGRKARRINSGVLPKHDRPGAVSLCHQLPFPPPQPSLTAQLCSLKSFTSPPVGFSHSFRHIRFFRALGLSLHMQSVFFICTLSFAIGTLYSPRRSRFPVRYCTAPSQANSRRSYKMESALQRRSCRAESLLQMNVCMHGIFENRDESEPRL